MIISFLDSRYGDLLVSEKEKNQIVWAIIYVREELTSRNTFYIYTNGNYYLIKYIY